ncbi:MAG: kinase [Alphaproteobacteria bacterium]|nr:kinase [Alphaproteobacteria bacterium]
MIITRTPFRVSLFGGGTDYPKWYREHGGAVLGLAINKYCYITLRRLPPFFNYRHRLVYSKIELVSELPEIQHPSVKACFKEMGVYEGLEVHHDGDLPARSGLGSSSSFTCGLLTALNAMSGKILSKRQLADAAIRIEQDVIGEAVGSQDQIWAAYGGMNRIKFYQSGDYDVQPIVMQEHRRKELENSLMMVFTGLSRTASTVAKKKIQSLEKKRGHLERMTGMVDEAMDILQNPERPLGEIGDLLHESWMLKRELTDQVSTGQVDEIYEAAREAGARGGKLLGAGGGGFMVFFVEPHRRISVKNRLRDLIRVPIRTANDGSRVVVYEPDTPIEV